MESKWSRGEISVLGRDDEGIINYIFDVLNRHERPFVLIGQFAHRWIGCIP